MTDETERRYIRMFNQFFKGSKNSTYKMMFLLSFIDLGLYPYDPHIVGSKWIERYEKKIILDLNFIVIRFIHYYWDMEYGFDLRHSPVPKNTTRYNDISITKILKKHIKEQRAENSAPPTLEELASERMEMRGLRAEVIKKSIKPEVLVHLLTDMEGLYTRKNKDGKRIKKDANKIVMDIDILPFLADYRSILKKAISYHLALFLERYNKGKPDIVSNVDKITTIKPIPKKKSVHKR